MCVCSLWKMCEGYAPPGQRWRWRGKEEDRDVQWCPLRVVVETRVNEIGRHEPGVWVTVDIIDQEEEGNRNLAWGAHRAMEKVFVLCFGLYRIGEFWVCLYAKEREKIQKENIVVVRSVVGGGELSRSGIKAESFSGVVEGAWRWQRLFKNSKQMASMTTGKTKSRGCKWVVLGMGENGKCWKQLLWSWFRHQKRVLGRHLGRKKRRKEKHKEHV